MLKSNDKNINTLEKRKLIFYIRVFRIDLTFRIHTLDRTNEFKLTFVVICNPLYHSPLSANFRSEMVLMVVQTSE